MNPSPTNSAIAAADDSRPCEQCGSDSPQGMRFCDKKCRALHEALAKLAEYEKAQSLMDEAEWEALKVLRDAGVNSLVAVALPLADGIRQVVRQRDSALSRAEQSEALLRKADQVLSRYQFSESGWHNNDDVNEIRDCIQAHLAPKETT